jgi:hypothetical protein
MANFPCFELLDQVVAGTLGFLRSRTGESSSRYLPYLADTEMLLVWNFWACLASHIDLLSKVPRIHAAEDILVAVSNRASFERRRDSLVETLSCSFDQDNLGECFEETSWDVPHQPCFEDQNPLGNLVGNW